MGVWHLGSLHPGPLHVTPSSSPPPLTILHSRTSSNQLSLHQVSSLKTSFFQKLSVGHQCAPAVQPTLHNSELLLKSYKPLDDGRLTPGKSTSRSTPRYSKLFSTTINYSSFSYLLKSTFTSSSFIFKKKKNHLALPVLENNKIRKLILAPAAWTFRPLLSSPAWGYAWVSLVVFKP